MKKKITKSVKGVKKELSVKTKHLMVTILGIIAVLVLSSAVTVYYYGDKLAIYDALSRQDVSLDSNNSNYLQTLAERGVDSCDDALCRSSVGVAVAHYGTIDDCKGDAYCINSYYAEKAANERNAAYCAKITSENLRDHCYYNVALLTDNGDLCEKITSNLLKNSCVNAI